MRKNISVIYISVTIYDQIPVCVVLSLRLPLLVINEIHNTFVVVFVKLYRRCVRNSETLSNVFQRVFWIFFGPEAGIVILELISPYNP